MPHQTERRRTDRLVMACTAICILCVVAVGVFSATVLDTKSTTEQIQEERAENIHRNCEETNARHDRTIRRLDELLARRLRIPGAGHLSDVELRAALTLALERTSRAQRAQIEQSRASTVLLIDPLVPVRECDKLVKQQVDTR